VLLTGRGVVSPLGVGIEPHWEALCAGRIAIASVPRLADLGLRASRGAEIPGGWLETYLARVPRKQQKLYNRATLLAAIAAGLAVDDAGLDRSHDPARFGVLIGVDVLHWSLPPLMTCLEAAESRDRPGSLDVGLANAFGMRHINPREYSLKMLPNLAAGQLAIVHDARGLSRALMEGPLGGTQAIGQAYRLIAEGGLDLALCGGTDARLEEFAYTSACGAGLVAPDGSEAGEVPGEGSGMLLLENGDRVAARSGPVFGEIRGFARAAGDGELAPRQDAKRLAHRLARVIGAAVEEAGGPPDVVVRHGDGIPAGEEAEERALETAFGPRASRVPVLTMKRLHGSLGAASAPIELLACSSVLRHGIIPPIISRVSGSPPTALRRGLVITLGLFGECAALVLDRAAGFHALPA
jgi:3-oxoacyl-[acyl-carrier-protein] synthase II